MTRWQYTKHALRLDLPARAFARFGADVSRSFARLMGELGLWLVLIALVGMPDGRLASAAYVGNSFPQAQLIAERTLNILAAAPAFTALVNLEYKKEFEAKQGQVIQVPKPPRYITRRGEAMQAQPATVPTVPVTVAPLIGVDIPIGLTEMALLMGGDLDRPDEWDRKIGSPAASQLLVGFEQELAALYANVYNLVGTPGTPPATLAALTAAKQRLMEENTPDDDLLGAVIGPRAWGTLVPGLSGNFVTRVIERAEMMGKLDIPLAGFPNGFVASQLAPSHTVGVYGGTPVVNGANQQGTSLLTKDWTAGSILKRGDVISITGCNAVNYQTRASTGVKRQFVVAADTLADAAGNMTIPLGNPITPPIAGVSQQWQTVDSFPADGAAITVDSGSSGVTYQQNLCFHKNAFLAVTLPQVTPLGSWYSAMFEYKGIAARCWIDSDIKANGSYMRLDILAGFGMGNQETAVRLTS